MWLSIKSQPWPQLKGCVWCTSGWCSSSGDGGVVLTGPSAAPSPCMLLQITMLAHHSHVPPPEASFRKQYTSSGRGAPPTLLCRAVASNKPAASCSLGPRECPTKTHLWRGPVGGCTSAQVSGSTMWPGSLTKATGGGRCPTEVPR